MTITTARTTAELTAVAELFIEVWDSPDNPPLAADMMREATHAGGAVHCAYDDGGLAGAAAAIFTADHGVYSLIAAARGPGRGVGFALKQAQRAWALERGATVMRWTFDPLVRRNARFNLVKLGARAVEYLPDFFGHLGGIDGDDPTDRLTACWDMAGPLAAAAAAGEPAEVAGPPEPGEPVRAPDGGPLALSTGGVTWCRVPADIVALRRADPARAAAWRTAVRTVMSEAFAGGGVATGITRDGWYRLEAAQ